MDKKDLGFDLDLKILEDGHKEYISQTRRKYFYLALDYAIKNKIKSVKVNRIKFYFDFDEMQVAIGESVEKAYIYKMKKI